MRFHSRPDLIRRARSYSSPGRDLLRGMGWGSVVGLIMAGFALLAGLGRLVIALAAGAAMPRTQSGDIRLLVVYVAAFAIGGAIVGAVTTRWDGRLAVSAACMGAGAVVMNALGLARADQPPGYNVPMAIGLTVIGAVFGLAFAYGLLREG